jgi:hypothetical protein
MKENEIGGTCSTNGVDEKCVQYFRWETRREEVTRKTSV